ncbi:tetratricopeptide repeat protein [Falsibacillus pallidus]|uniref:tetratricopeptide repeat protein n=1 Tax=Falsibacillus pallidus TaxID=493781 RepID=UPI003D9685AC
MKKKVKKEGNVVYLPNLKDRYLEVGLDHLKAQHFKEAIESLEKAREHNEEQEQGDIDMALAIALYESRRYEEAKDICRDLLHKGVGDYFDIVDLYLMSLIQLKEHKEIESVIKMLFEEKEVPPEKAEHFQKLLQFSERIAHTTSSENDEPLVEVADEAIQGLSEKSLEEQTLFIAQLADRNIHPYLQELMGFLASESSHPFLQTMVLNTLKEHGVEKTITINKLNMESVVVPAELSEPFSTPFFAGLSEKLEDAFSHESPTLLEQTMDIVRRHAFLYYPFSLLDGDIDLAAAAYQTLMQGYYGDMPPIDEAAEQYGVNAAELEAGITLLQRLEEISLPIL